ncbi:hypothetical protein G4V62_07025 [Bacillaceae bacterium SIJ1]|uniref:hypothetical protein n=1 Tax=Litoribacterium kuwaitense TaxID=1398745 RepID=UPI0013E9AC3B|nr:hypothetical protein [Litoribacterium kuwaitense]NGP44717.1 hypothetical protein [Litoribacterium kuwaitense]
MKRVLAITGLAFIGIHGCSSGDDALEQQGTVPLQTTDLTGQDHFYQRDLADGDQASVNQSPSFRDLVEDRPDLGDDHRAIARTVNRTDGVRTTLVTIVGNRVTVQARFQQNYNAQEKEQITDDLFGRLQEQMPRYDIHLVIR